MKKMGQTLLRGLLTVIPISLSIYLLILFFSWAENLMKSLIGIVYRGDFYIPGMGLVFGVVAIYGLGLMMETYSVQRIFSIFEVPFKNVPLVKSIYVAIKDLLDFFSPGTKTKGDQVVLVRFPDLDMELVGFLTNEEPSGMGLGSKVDGKIAVYLPLSYQIGGYTVFVPKAWVTKVSLGVEDAMRSSLTAWMRRS